MWTVSKYDWIHNCIQNITEKFHPLCIVQKLLTPERILNIEKDKNSTLLMSGLKQWNWLEISGSLLNVFPLWLYTPPWNTHEMFQRDSERHFKVYIALFYWLISFYMFPECHIRSHKHHLMLKFESSSFSLNPCWSIIQEEGFYISWTDGEQFDLVETNIQLLL